MKTYSFFEKYLGGSDDKTIPILPFLCRALFVSLWITASASRGRGSRHGSCRRRLQLNAERVLWLSGKHLYCCHFYRCWVHGEHELREMSHRVCKRELLPALPKKNSWRPQIYSVNSRAVLSLVKWWIYNIQRSYAQWGWQCCTSLSQPTCVRWWGGMGRDMAGRPQLNPTGPADQSRAVLRAAGTSAAVGWAGMSVPPSCMGMFRVKVGQQLLMGKESQLGCSFNTLHSIQQIMFRSLSLFSF